MKGYAARDENGRLNFFLGVPHRFTNPNGDDYWVGHGRMKQPNEFLPELSWDDDPIAVEISIKRI